MGYSRGLYSHRTFAIVCPTLLPYLTDIAVDVYYFFGCYLEALSVRWDALQEVAIRNLIVSYDEGTALAIEILSNIFRVKRNTKFEPIYLASYYSCMADSLLQVFI